MGGTSAALDAGSGGINPNFSSSADSGHTTTGVNIGGSAGPTLYLGNTGTPTSTIIIIVVGVVLVIFFLKRG